MTALGILIIMVGELLIILGCGWQMHLGGIKFLTGGPAIIAIAGMVVIVAGLLTGGGVGMLLS